MQRAELRLRLLQITHHHAQGKQINLEIARYYEDEYFADIVFDDDKPKTETKAPKAAKG